MGKKSFLLGDVGAGARMKLVINMIMGSMLGRLCFNASVLSMSACIIYDAMIVLRWLHLCNNSQKFGSKRHIFTRLIGAYSKIWTSLCNTLSFYIENNLLTQKLILITATQQVMCSTMQSNNYCEWTCFHPTCKSHGQMQSVSFNRCPKLQLSPVDTNMQHCPSPYHQSAQQ